MVCPTQVGIHRSVISPNTPYNCLPHAGGDTPTNKGRGALSIWSAPRRWGYTVKGPDFIAGYLVCPTQVGIHLLSVCNCHRRPCLPHAGGDTPDAGRIVTVPGLSAPRRWGYTLNHTATPEGRRGLPHAGGDTPYMQFQLLFPM